MRQHWHLCWNARRLQQPAEQHLHEQHFADVQRDWCVQFTRRLHLFVHRDGLHGRLQFHERRMQRRSVRIRHVQPTTRVVLGKPG